VTPSRAIERYCRAFSRQDVEDILALLAPNALYELPFLSPRLVGEAEIRTGLEEAFAKLLACSLSLEPAVEQVDTAIAEGRLEATRADDGLKIDTPVAIVVRTAEAGITRLSHYCDARPYRLWSDRLILALDH